MDDDWGYTPILGNLPYHEMENYMELLELSPSTRKVDGHRS